MEHRRHGMNVQVVAALDGAPHEASPARGAWGKGSCELCPAARTTCPPPARAHGRGRRVSGPATRAREQSRMRRCQHTVLVGKLRTEQIEVALDLGAGLGRLAPHHPPAERHSTRRAAPPLVSVRAMIPTQGLTHRPAQPRHTRQPSRTALVTGEITVRSRSVSRCGGRTAPAASIARPINVCPGAGAPPISSTHPGRRASQSDAARPGRLRINGRLSHPGHTRQQRPPRAQSPHPAPGHRDPPRRHRATAAPGGRTARQGFRHKRHPGRPARISRSLLSNVVVITSTLLDLIRGRCVVPAPPHPLTNVDGSARETECTVESLTLSTLSPV